ncbi:hypothetical protein [Succinimonas sp.]|uniref:hypothetical protein n=1 Tax=Succinimonas sp. TaxID=1936151 RepID=UPI0038663D5A
MYYIRKLSKPNTVNKLRNMANIEDAPADLLKQEWPTTGNTLSFWKCESLDNTADTIKAIILSATGIEKSRFIIFDDDMLDEYGIKRDFSEEGKTGYKGFEGLHVNFCELTYGKIGSVISMTKEALGKENMVIDLSRDAVKEHIKEVCDAGLINTEQIHESLLADIRKYGLLVD